MAEGEAAVAEVVPGAPRAPHDPPAAIFLRFLRFGALAWGGPGGADRDDQARVRRRGGLGLRGDVSQDARRLPGAPGPEAHELCVYFGRMRGGKLGGFARRARVHAARLPPDAGALDPLCRGEPRGHLDELFYGLTAAVGAIVARALVRLSRTFITDVPLALIAVAAFAVTLVADANFVSSCSAPGSSTSFGPTPARWAARPLVRARAGGARRPRRRGDVSLTATIFCEGLKAGLVTFGGAFTVIPFLQESAVDAHHWLTDEQFVDGLAIGGVLPAPLIIFSTFVGYLAGGLAGGMVMTLGIFLPAFVFPIFLHRRLVAIAENERIRPFLLGVAAGGDRADRRGHGRDRRHERRRRLHRGPGDRGVRGPQSLARQADGALGRPRVRRDRRALQLTVV